MLKGSFGDTCRLALNLNSWFVLERHLTRGRSSNRPRVTSVKVLSRSDEEMQGKDRSGTHHVCSTSRKVVSNCFDFGRGKKNNKKVLECWGAFLQNGLGRDITQIFTHPWLHSYLTKYSLSLLLLIQKYPFMSVFKCCPPYLFHWGFSSSWNTVGTWEGVG